MSDHGHGGESHGEGGEDPGVWISRAFYLFACIIVLLALKSKKHDQQVKDDAAAVAAASAKQAAQAAPPAKPLVVRVAQKDCNTPCSMEITELRDLYTDGEPVWILPPGWPKDKAIHYEGKGHLIIRGGNIHTGTWNFWADNEKEVTIRVFEKQ